MRNRAQNRALICIAALGCASISGESDAADQPAAEAAPLTCNLRVDPQPLAAALQEVARQCGVQVVYFSGITDGLSASGLQGAYSVDAALHRLLDHVGLSFRHINAATIEIRAAEAKNSSAEPSAAPGAGGHPPRRKSQFVASTEESVPEVVINGTAEGLVATRTETPLQDIPQTISLISAEQMRQQNNVTVEDALADAVGITVVQLDSLNRQYNSRGFPITNYTLDGGASLHSLPLGAGNGIGLFFQVPDLSEFDRIEVLRGSDGLFGANGTPGGTLNLVRKRPLLGERFMFSSSAGSWNNYREEIDVTGPLGLEGALRGRLDASYIHSDYFYDEANEGHKSIFAVLDYDITARTTLTVGGSYRWEHARPFEGGLPQFSDGTDARLPRGTSFTFDWSKFDTQTREAYLRIDQRIQETWRVQVNATSLRGSIDFAYGQFFSALDPVTHGLDQPPTGGFTLWPGEHDLLTGEVTVTGTQEWLGHKADIAFGGDYTHTTSSLTTGYLSPFGTPLPNVYAYNPAAYPDPTVNPGPGYVQGQESSDLQSGFFASLKLQLASPWSVTAGLRVSNERTTATAIPYLQGIPHPVPSEFEYVGKVTPFIATLLRINDTYSVYASYADIYRSNQGATRIGEKRLSPADGIDIEAGIKAAWRDGRLHGALTLYKITQRGLALPDDNAPIDDLSNSCCYISGRSTSEGVDLELSGSLAPGWLIGGGYSYNSNSVTASVNDPSGDFQSPQTPRHLLKLWTSSRLPGHWQQWSVGGTLQAQTRNLNHSFSCPSAYVDQCALGVESIVSIQGSYLIISPRIGYRIDEHWQLALTVNNVFDKHYYQTIGGPTGGSWYGAPRNFLLRLDARF